MVDLHFPQVLRFPSSLSFDLGHMSWNQGLMFFLKTEQQCHDQLPSPYSHRQVLPSRAHQASSVENHGKTSLSILSGPFKAAPILFRHGRSLFTS